MWFDKIEQIAEIAAKNGTSVFVVPRDEPIEIKNAVVLEPEEKSVITVDQVRKVTASLGLKQQDDRFVIIRPADKMSEVAANAFLKNLEEPGNKVHYILVTDTPARLLPTILSRAVIYFWREGMKFSTDITADEKKKDLAKRLIAAGPRDVVALVEEITKKKNGVREYALETLGLAIEMLYKSYFITSKEMFVKKLPKFLTAYENISKNGHVKLQIVANMI